MNFRSLQTMKTSVRDRFFSSPLTPYTSLLTLGAPTTSCQIRQNCQPRKTFSLPPKPPGNMPTRPIRVFTSALPCAPRAALFIAEPTSKMLLLDWHVAPNSPLFRQWQVLVSAPFPKLWSLPKPSRPLAPAVPVGRFCSSFRPMLESI